jgi:Ca2+-binding RTX toxin-like protein
VGDAGSDKFRFDTAVKAGVVDTVADFKPEDALYFKKTAFAGFGATFEATEYYQGTKAYGAEDRLIYDQAVGIDLVDLS